MTTAPGSYVSPVRNRLWLRPLPELKAFRINIADTHAAGHVSDAGVTPVLCGAVVHPQKGAVLFGNHAMTELAKASSRLGHAGWRICPTPTIGVGITPSGGAVARTRSLEGGEFSVPVAFFATDPSLLLPTEKTPAQLAPDAGEAAAQLVCWAARPTTAAHLKQLAQAATRIPARVLRSRISTEHDRLISAGQAWSSSE